MSLCSLPFPDPKSTWLLPGGLGTCVALSPSPPWSFLPVISSRPACLVLTTFAPGFQAKWVCTKTVVLGLGCTRLALITATFLAKPPGSDGRWASAGKTLRGPRRACHVGQAPGAGSAEAAEPPVATRWQPAPGTQRRAGRKEASPCPRSRRGQS